MFFSLTSFNLHCLDIFVSFLFFFIMLISFYQEFKKLHLP
ncbi:hypothetical protein B4135_2627 [Caldibacillus debilis]|uniref:Uncharacterized protein n=1 Tax=Caldibacillus debilis TaxID=301148 RepID=A0A150LV06_9BACI|nr:hypothetical protein B4135_2627 [Caldibacillus debilis]